MGNITYDGKIVTDDLKYIDLPAKDVPKFTVKRGDMLFNRTNSADLVGKCAVYDMDEPFAFAGYLVRARAKKIFCAEYIAGYLNSTHGKAVLRKMAKSIVGMANINAKEMQSIPILIPDRVSQDRYFATLDRLKTERAQQYCALASLDGLFISLQSRAFSSELR